MGRGRAWQRVIFAVLCAACCALPAAAASLDELTPYLTGNYFTWREFSGGRRLLKESGPLFAGGAVAELVTVSALTLRGRAEIFGGVVNYDGETQEQIPVKTEVSYLGTKQEFDLGYRYAADGWHLEPFTGLGYRWWLRGLHDSTAVDGQPASGYTEYWRTGYLRLGMRGRYRTASGASLFAEGGAKYPFYTANDSDPFGNGVHTYRPGGDWSSFAETGVSYRRLKLSLSYEGFRFSPSPVVVVVFNGVNLLHQPESVSSIIGLNLGWSF
jgi:hypothetical protein